ncbi:FKBP-type peptidyl-prolyl cis-trans isomerase [Schaalia sp. lx-260]|uniref:FKBP-type peptidyl-prolyl cis-trans isomerase n=1 Tax=Schaalia sp. lx-260 TaxID=2899082 RepID=UPI001E5406C3|nr:FKBP-type peptidyl-prolyl cis-trans isomerase [Schaalia sp. lx-260]MCD4549503.1 FKBP-type peptidyl-prolyl cis-trans isomerase [Schaalia sp. lx-260]
MKKPTQRWFALTLTLSVVLTMGLAGCSSTSETAASGSQSVAANMPEVDRSGTGNFPDVTGDFGQNPQIAAGNGDAPTDKIWVKTLHQGNGPEVGADDTIRVNYTGTLWDGKVFDSSFMRNTPISFSLNGVIAGWKYGLASQHVGDRVELVIPAQWAYGDQAQNSIPAGSTLVFVVDILDTVNGSDLSALKGASLTGETIEGIEVSGELGQEPKITFTGAPAPAEAKIITLAKGAGHEIVAGDSVIIHGMGGTYGDENSINGTWQPPHPVTVDAAAYGLVGYTVGSRLLMTQPISAQQGQSGDDSQSASPSTQILVVDVVASLSAAS